MEVAIDVTVPREAIYQTVDNQTDSCPKCGGTLHQSYQHYFIATGDSKTEEDAFFAGGKFGWFCDSCPTVVIDTGELMEHFKNLPSGWTLGTKFNVLGLVDIEAIPEEKRDLPIGDKRNPVPLVPFTNVDLHLKKEKERKPTPRKNPDHQWGSKVLRKYTSQEKRKR